MGLSKTQNGNILFLILIAVALFAALSYALSSTNRNNDKALTDERAKLIASRILSDLTKLNQIENYVRLFTQKELFAGNSGAICSSNASGGRYCVFAKSNPYYVDRRIQLKGLTLGWVSITANQNRGVSGIGGTGEVMMYMKNIPEEVCPLINKGLNISYVPQTSGVFSTNQISYTGTKYMTACVRESNGGYMLYRVLEVV